MRLSPLIWSLPLALAPLAGCQGSSCGQTGCLGTVELLLTHPLNAPGTYVLDVQVGTGDTVRCTVEQPSHDTACDQRWADVLTGVQGTVDGLILYRTDIQSVSVSVARDGLVIGGGTVGVELAAEVVEKVRDVGGCLWCVQQWSHVLSFATRCVI